MSIGEGLILFWLLPALITLLAYLRNHRKNYRRPEKLDADDWGEMALAGTFYPIVWVVVLLDFIGPHLTKERNIWA